MYVKQWWWLAVALLLVIGIVFALKPLFLRQAAPLSIVIAQLQLPCPARPMGWSRPCW